MNQGGAEERWAAGRDKAASKGRGAGGENHILPVCSWVWAYLGGTQEGCENRQIELLCTRGQMWTRSWQVFNKQTGSMKTQLFQPLEDGLAPGHGRRCYRVERYRWGYTRWSRGPLEA